LSWLWRCFFALLALVVPALVGYDVYFQWRTPALDLNFDRHTGLVYEVPQGTPADWAGFGAGDVILSVDGIPFSEWNDPPVGNYLVKVERDGKYLILELPVLPLAKVHLLSLVSAAVVALIFWGIGTLLLLRRFQEQEVRLLFLLAQAFAILLLFPLAHPHPSVLPIWAIDLSNACFYLAAPLLLHYYLTFPVPLGTPRQRRWGLSVIYVLALISIAFWLSGAPLARWGAIYAILEVAAAVVVLVYVYLRRATPDGRRRLRLVVFGIVMAAGPPIFLYIIPFMTGASYGIPEWLTALFLVVAPLSYLYATARHNLFGIDRLLNRALVYALLSIGILFLYLGPFLLIYRFLPGDPLAQMMVAAGLTLLVGLAFDWSRTQAQRFVDRLFYGGWYDYPGVVETVSANLARTLEREQLADVLTRQLPELMQLRPGHLWIGEQNQPPSHPVTQFPLIFQGQVRGLWSVEPRRDGEDFTASDRRILETLADQAEISLSNVLLVETLRRQLDQIRASREMLAQAQRQLLRSREEERARLARELHDGPIQSLVAMNLQLSLLLSQPSPPASLPTLREGSPPSLSQDWEREGKGKGEGDSPPVQALRAMRDEVRYLLADLRRACAELRPPILDALGLVPALRALAEDWSLQSDVPVCLDLPSDDTSSPLPEEVEVNLYRVVQEALTNVTRHAAARQVTIRLVELVENEEPFRLTLTIQDDGRGFVVPTGAHDLTAQDHFGLVSMQERVNLIGGAWTIESTPGQGTTVHVLWQAQD